MSEVGSSTISGEARGAHKYKVRCNGGRVGKDDYREPGYTGKHTGKQ
jgi:hypothetical protein